MDLCGKDRATGGGAETGGEAPQFISLDDKFNCVVDMEADTQGLDNLCSSDNAQSLDSCKKKK